MKLSILVVFSLYSFSGFAQNFWTKIDQKFALNEDEHEKYHSPEKVDYYQLDEIRIQKQLLNAPDEFSENSISIELPIPEKGVVLFQTFSSPVMMPGLSKKYPGIRSFKAYNHTERLNVRFDISPLGFRAFIQSPSGPVFIVPVQKGNNLYRVFRASNEISNSSMEEISCGQGTLRNAGLDNSREISDMPGWSPNSLKSFSDPIQLRIYRLALACTGEWGTAKGNTTAEVLAEMNSSVNFLNQIFENELAIRMKLVENNDQLVFLNGTTDPFDQARSGGDLLDNNTNILNSIIGFTSYDIGHIYTIGCTDTGGIAFLRSACTVNKAAGVTCHANTNTLNVTLNIAAHEFGHQFGANHSFNNCSGNENFGTAYEPGSGSTIMSYAGICGPNNIQAIHDDYYHSISLQEIFNFTRNGSGNTCPEKIDLANTTPIASHSYSNNFFIPVETPFELTGDAIDMEDDSLTYIWEQFNLGPQSGLGNPIENAPSFRSISPGVSSHRLFPHKNALLNNTPQITEVLPSSSRNLDFRFVVRDNHIEGGGISWESLQFKSTDNAGPFQIIYPNTRDTLVIGSQIDITWDVSGTDQSPVDCQLVNIWLSTDDNYSFDMLLAENVINDGSEQIIIPNMPTTKARIKIKAANNIFFDISDENFTISQPEIPGYFIDILKPGDEICIPSTVAIPILTTSFNGYMDSLFFKLIEPLPEGLSASFSPPLIESGDTAILSLDFNNVLFSGLFELGLLSISTSKDTLQRSIQLQLTNTNFNEIVLESPASESIGNKPFSVFEWARSPYAKEYSFQLADNPSFSENALLYDFVTNDTSFTSPSPLEVNEIFFWRVNGINNCDISSYSTTSIFQTETLSCKTETSSETPVNISASGTRTVEASVFIANDGMVKDINIINIKGTHEQVSDLRISLISPSGTQAILFNRLCGNLANFDMGFDDDSTVDVDCPATGGVKFRPVDSLSIFNDEPSLGSWVLRIEDQNPGFGGAFNQFILEVCTNVSPEQPFIINHSALETPPGIQTRIKKDLLLIGDTNNSDDQLLFTLMSVPMSGELILDDQILQIGDQFYQKDINDNRFKYRNTLTDVSEDDFHFIVEDGEGGWIKNTRFEIKISSDFTSSTIEIPDHTSIDVFPNPVTDQISLISDSQIKGPFHISLIDLNGRKIWSTNFQKLPSEISFNQDFSGLYFLRISGKDVQKTKKIVFD